MIRRTDINRAYAGEQPAREAFSGFEAALVEQRALQGEEYARAKAYYDSVFRNCDTDFLPAKDNVQGEDEKAAVGVYSRREPGI